MRLARRLASRAGRRSSRRVPIGSLPFDQQHDYLVAVVARFLRNVAGPAGTLLLLDDLQWVDADTLELYVALLAVADLPLRVVAAYRDTDLRPNVPLDTVLSGLAQNGLAEQHRLERLSPAAAQALLQALLGEEDMDPERRDTMLARASGVPLYLVSYARALPAGEEVPWDVARGVRQRVAALAVETQQVLQVAAVMGEIQWARLAKSFSPDMTDAALDEAGRAGLLVQEGVDRYRFVHELIQQTVEADLGPGQRTALHRRIAQALEQTEAGALPVEVLAYHYSRCDEVRAAHYFELAGDRAQGQGAIQAAEVAYRAALDRLDRTGRPLEAAGVRMKLGRALRSAGRAYGEALALLEAAAAAFRDAGKWEHLGQAAAEIAYAYAAAGKAREGIGRLTELRVLLETEVALGGPGRGLAALEAAFAQLFISAGLFEEHLGALERAVALARQEDDPEILAAAELNRGVALLILGQVPEGVSVLEEGARLTEASSNLSALVTTLVTAAALLLPMTELEAALTHLRRAREVADRLGDLVTLAFICYLQGDVLRFQGGWDQAQVSYERGLRLAQQVEGSWIAWAPAMGLGLLSMNRGELAEARTYLEESRRQAQRSGYPFAVPWVETTLVTYALCAGCLAEAGARLRSLSNLPSIPTLTNTVQFLGAWVALEDGDLDTASELAGQARAGAALERARTGEVHAIWIQARIETRQQRWDEARAILDEGLALAHHGPYLPGELLLLEAYAELEQAGGNETAARDRLEEALALLRPRRAAPEVQRLTDRLAGLSSLDGPL